MSGISNQDLERLARLMMCGDEGDIPEIVRLLLMDDDTCDALRDAQHPEPAILPLLGDK